MDEPANNHAVEKRMKEALKKDRSRIQVGKMSMFGLLELSRQRMHSAFWESNYQVCPYCHGKGITRTLASAGVYILRALEEEGIKNRSSKLNIFVPSDVAVYLLNHKRKVLSDLEEKYKLDIVISADDSVKCISDYRIERTKAPVLPKEDKPEAKPLDKEVEAVAPVEEPVSEPEIEMPAEQPEQSEQNGRDFRGRRGRRGRFDRRRGRGNYDRRSSEATAPTPVKEKQEAVILYNSHEDIAPQPEQPAPEAQPEKKGKSTWWKKLIKG